MEKLTIAMGDVWGRDAVLGALLAGLDIQHDPTTATMSTDGRRLLINDKWASALTRNQLTLVLAHEALHVAREHHLRRGKIARDKFNQAADMAINHELRAWPGAAWIDETGTTAAKAGLPAGLSAEEYAKLIPEPLKPPEPPEPPEPEQDEAGAGQDKPQMAGAGEVIDSPEPDPIAAAQEQEERMLAAIETAEQCGALPGWAQGIKAALTAAPKLNWKVLLRQWLLQRARVRRTFERPSRRQAVLGGQLLRPGRGGRRVGKVAVLVDVSGSMRANVDLLNAAIAEIRGLAKAMPDTEIRVIQWDAAVIKTEDLKGGDAEKKTLDWRWGGGGGTVIAPALKAASGWRPDVQVVWTDGFFTMPEKILIPTLWCMVTDVQISKKLGQTITMEAI